MRFKTIDHSVVISFDNVHNIFSEFVPEKDVAAVGARDDVFAIGSVKIDTFY